MTDAIKLVIADDHPLLRQGVRQVIEKDARLQIVAEASDGQAALESIQTLRPDLALLDVDMPRLSGFDVARALRRLDIPLHIIFLTVHCEEEFFNEALALGAQGYILKESAVTDVLAAIEAVRAGQNFVSSALTSYLIKQRRSTAEPPRAQLADLTPTERQIIKLIADYKTSKQIAEMLFISPHTVQTHRKNICAKLNLEGNHALLRFALEHQAQL